MLPSQYYLPGGQLGYFQVESKPTPQEIWLTNVLVKMSVARVLTNVGEKNELGLYHGAGHAKILETIQARAKILIMTK